MKTIKKFLLIIFLLPMVADAQVFRIDTSEISYENKLRPCFVVQYDAPSKTVKKGWSDFFKKKYDIKTKGISLLSNKDVISTEDVKIATISDKRMNIYAKVTDLAAGSELKYFMSFGYDFFIGPEKYPAEFEAMKKVLDEFSVSFLNDYYASESSSLLKQIRNAEKEIKSKNRAIEKNLKKAGKSSSAVSSALEAKNNALRNDIELYKEKIKGYEKEIEVIKEKQSGILNK